MITIYKRVAAIAKDIPMEVVKRKHEGASNRYVGLPRINTRVVLFVIDIKEEDVHDKSTSRMLERRNSRGARIQIGLMQICGH